MGEVVDRCDYRSKWGLCEQCVLSPHDDDRHRFSQVPEVIYAVRRTDGELMGDFSFWTVNGPTDWDPTDWDSDDLTDPVEYQMLKMTVEVIDTRTSPRCHDCDDPATHWGLCEKHASEDDPSAFEDMLS